MSDPAAAEGAPASAPAASATSSTTNPFPPHSSTPVRVSLRAIGSAPILRRTKFKVGALETVRTVTRFLRGQLGLADSEPLFVCVQSPGGPFLAAPDDLLGPLAREFGAEGELVLSYSLVPPVG